MLRSLLIHLFLASSFHYAAGTTVRLKPGQQAVMQIREGRGFLRLRMEKDKGTAAPGIHVVLLQDNISGRQLEGSDYLKAAWDPPEKTTDLTELDLRISTSSIAVPFSEATALLQFRSGIDMQEFPVMLTARLPVGNRLTRVGSDSVQLNLSNGRGEAFILFNRASGIAQPTVLLIAPQESGVTLPAGAFETSWDKSGNAWNAADTVTLRIAVKEGAKLPLFGNATGNIILRWPEGDQPFLPFRVVDVSQRSFSVVPATASIFSQFQRPSVVRVYVENIGVPPIDHLRFSFTPLTDAENKRELQPEVHEVKDMVLRRFEGRSFEVPIPVADFAGTYQGTMKVSANSSQMQSVAVTMRTRGPWQTWGVPLPLFFVVLSIGFWAARRLAAWLDLGGEQRNQTLLSLHVIRRHLERILAQLSESRDLLPNTVRRVDFATEDIQEALSQAERRTPAELDGVRQKTESLAVALKQLVRAVTFIVTNRPDQRKTALPRLDVLDPADASYSAAVTRVLETLPPPSEGSGILRAPADVEALMTQVPSPPDESNLKSQRAWAEFLVKAATLFSVFAIAYMTVFVNDPDFGTFTDYLQTILYGLGLSTAGAGILTRARSSFQRIP